MTGVQATGRPWEASAVIVSAETKIKKKRDKITEDPTFATTKVPRHQPVTLL